MKKLYEMNVSDFDVKKGDIKIDSEELKKLFYVLETYHSMLCVMLNELDDEEKEKLENGMQFVEYMQNKYLVLQELRMKQKWWYDKLKQTEDKEFTKNATEKEIERVRRDIWGYYIEAKTERENLAKELEKINEKCI